MAVFRVTSRTWIRDAAKATVRYIAYAHQRDKEGKAKPRQLFGKDGEELIKYQVYRMIDKAPGDTTFFRLVISPDRKKEDANQDLDLKTLTEMTMIQLQDRFPNQNIGYVAAVHTNTDNRHVHILALIQAKRIPKKDLTLLISTATKEARQQRQELDRESELLPIRSLQQNEPFRRQTFQLQAYQPSSCSRFSGRMKREHAAAPARWIPSCPNCGPYHPMERSGRRRFECLSCGLRLKQTGLGIEISRGPGLELSLEGVGDP